MAPFQKEKITRVFLTEKINRLAEKQASFIQVGDSSGFYGIRPNTVMANLNLEQNNTWLNFGCCGKTGFSGYQSLFETVNNIQRQQTNDNTTYFVLAMTPYYPPKEEFENGDLAESLESQNKFLKTNLPSSALRLSITNGLYKGEFKNQLLSSRVNSYWGKSLDDMRPDLLQLGDELGWMEHVADPIAVPTDICNFDMEKEGFFSQKLLSKSEFKLENTLDNLYQDLNKKGIKLVLALNPVPCQLRGSPDVEEFNTIIKRFGETYPAVIIPFKAVRQYPENLFRDKWHLNKQGAEKNSTEIGKRLNKML